MAGLISLWVIIFVLLATLFKLIYDSQKKYKWFNSLKPNDSILVRIYSKHCECARKATVIKQAEGKFIKAKLLKQDRIACDKCSRIKGLDKNKENTCWYNVTMFHKDDVEKL